MTDAKPADAGTPSAAYNRMEEHRRLLRDLMGGTRAMRAAGTTWLPREPGEIPQPGPDGFEIDPYQVRLDRSVLIPHFADSAEKLTGKVFAEDITFSEDMPQQLTEWAEDIDKRGHNLTQFMRPLFLDMWVEGMPFVLVENGQTEVVIGPSGVPQKKDDHPEMAFWIYYPSAACHRSRFHFEGGKLIWDKIQLRESVETDDGEWEQEAEERIRVLRRGNPKSKGDDRFCSFEFHRKNERGEWIPSVDPKEQPGYMRPHTEIPGRFFRFGRELTPEGTTLGPNEIWPELEALAWLCLQHWQKKSDQDALVHRVKNAMLHWAGITEEEFAKRGPKFIGPFCLFVGGEALTVVESSGAGAEIGFKDLQSLEDAIRLASLRPEIPEKAYATLGEKVIDTGEGESRLKASAILLRDGLEALFEITARQMDPTMQAGSVIVNTDYSLSQADAAQISALMQTRADKANPQLSRKTFLAALKKTIDVLEDMDVDAEELAIRQEIEDDSLALARMTDLNQA